ncbi:translation initiation factor IF-2 [Melissococcus plutonius]|uniref:translation initiation factor IF-2 n=1 Tax=Melissococcus plutonius TaxID=33970 RepID=UPI00065E493D|nr:translation initiation factor IF-2 [Melissococcus plutonius]AIM25154.1 translation initiation factor IF-2 [Melissococcus plutonius S1]KMT25410.1 translation initiation factor IF-2 [Melissococcus plutonius]KMT25450.1 translation initiation factor IF-2 [Melissococcus plutonius]KMT26314.1 translation initiation factor IF-2 [Melissococcus plutonius]KMT29056.1 translation initiation factor IF-2 [Melissococcus plutonius]
MGKKRIYELAKELNQSSKIVVQKANEVGINVKNHMGAITPDDEAKLRNIFQSKEKNMNNTKDNKTNHSAQKRSNEKVTADNNSKTKPVNMQKEKNQHPIKKENNYTKKPENNHTTQSTNKTVNHHESRDLRKNNSFNNQNRNTTTSNDKKNVNKQPKNNEQTKSMDTRNQTNTQTNTQNNNQHRNNTGSNKRNHPMGGNQFRNTTNNSYNNLNKFNKKGKKGKKGKQQEAVKPAVPPRKFRELPDVLEYSEGMNVADIAKKIHREPAEIIKKLFMMGVIVNQNQALDKDTIELLAVDYGMEPQEKVQVDLADIDKFFEPEAIAEENLTMRPPVVTIMGHVDHGKTTLLDTLRHSRVTSGEAGGITQHIGAYQLSIEGKPITFLDTPGHAAFTSMRARGASITDITILIVAADDGVMPQTVEAINHAKAANVPIIVAVNKVDKPGANPDHVKQELSEYELIPEEWGGDTIFVNISAKYNQNIDELLENILLIAEIEDLKADPTQRAIGTVIEARLDKGKGTVATLLIQQGTLHVGDPIVVGNTYGRVRAMTNDIGRREKEAGPATPVEITGLNDVPQAGDHFVIFEDEKTARQAGEERAKRALLEQRSTTSRVTLNNLFESLKEGELKEVNVIIKADVQGSAEALAASLQKIDVEGVRVKIVHSTVGTINESDITLAQASNAIIIGFNVRPTPQAKQQAEFDEVDIRLHKIIYKAIEEIETAMKGMLDPEFKEKITGQMVVRELYRVSKVGTIAGCYVTEGAIQRDGGVRVIRDGIVIYEGKLASLKRYKDDVKEVRLGFECGAMIENFNDIKVDDNIEGFIMEEIKNV